MCDLRNMYVTVLIDRIRDYSYVAIGEEQSGFSVGRGCADIFLCRTRCVKKYLAKGNDGFWAVVDLETAYDKVNRYAMWKVL